MVGFGLIGPCGEARPSSEATELVIESLHLLRYVDTTSIVHRANARTKVLALTVLVFAFSFDPAWSTVAVIWTLVTLGFVAARLPRRAIPRPPRLLLWSMAIALLFGLFAGGEPFVDVLGWSVGVGGLRLQIRFFAVTLGLLAMALLLGWTTRLGDLPPAAAWMLTPLRWVRIPTDEVVAGLTLAVRALPLMADEFATTTAMWSVRPRRAPTAEAPRGSGAAMLARVADAIDLAATATTSASRRAAELGEAVGNRGQIVVPSTPARWGLADVVVVIVTSAVVAAIALL